MEGFYHRFFAGLLLFLVDLPDEGVKPVVNLDPGSAQVVFSLNSDLSFELGNTSLGLLGIEGQLVDILVYGVNLPDQCLFTNFSRLKAGAENRIYHGGAFAQFCGNGLKSQNMGLSLRCLNSICQGLAVERPGPDFFGFFLHLVPVSNGLFPIHTKSAKAKVFYPGCSGRHGVPLFKLA